MVGVSSPNANADAFSDWNASPKITGTVTYSLVRDKWIGPTHYVRHDTATVPVVDMDINGDRWTGTNPISYSINEETTSRNIEGQLNQDDTWTGNPTLPGHVGMAVYDFNNTQ